MMKIVVVSFLFSLVSGIAFSQTQTVTPSSAQPTLRVGRNGGFPTIKSFDSGSSGNLVIDPALASDAVVFMVAGKNHFHVILETLDTEEATYVWHSEKSKSVLMEAVKQIDLELNIIREKGRQAYLETNPMCFSRVLHDYSDDNKGFSIWKGQLEELFT